MATKDHLQTALIQEGEDGYLNKETDFYKSLLDSAIPASNPNSYEGLGKFKKLIKKNHTIYALSNANPESSKGKGHALKDNWYELKAPDVELRHLPAGVKYAFLGPNSTYPVIVNDSLNEKELGMLLSKIRNYRKCLGYSLDDIKGIQPSFCTLKELGMLLSMIRNYRKCLGYSLDDIKRIQPSFCTHRIHLENETYSSIEPQRRLNPNLKEVVKKEILKLLKAYVIYPISDIDWVAPLHCVPKKGGMIVHGSW